MRVITLGVRASNATFGVKDKLRLFALKRDPRALHALYPALCRGCAALQYASPAAHIVHANLIALQHMPDFGMGRTRMGAHHRFIEFWQPVNGRPLPRWSFHRPYTACQPAGFSEHRPLEHLRQHWDNL